MNFKKVWERTLRKAGVAVLPALRSSLHVRHPAERRGVADEWVTQLLRQTDAKVFKKYSQMKLQMKREALAKLNRKANEMETSRVLIQEAEVVRGFDTVLIQF